MGWKSISTLPYDFRSGAAVVYDNKIHILGSSNSSNYTKHYSWNGSQWSEESTLPYNFYRGAAVVYDNKIHLLGGEASGSAHFVWDGTQWTQKPNLPITFLYSSAAVVYDNKLHILGSSHNTYTKSHYSWDGSQWSEESELPYVFYRGSAVVYNNKIHILGGYNGIYHYSWNGSQWSEESELPYGLASGSAVVYDNKIHILGGFNSNTGTKHYSWNGSQWSEKSELPYDFANGSAVVYNDKIYILGGTSNTTKHYAFQKSINKVVYGVNILIDLTNDTIAPDKLLSGYTAHDASGDEITGELVGTSVTPSDSNPPQLTSGNLYAPTANGYLTEHGVVSARGTITDVAVNTQYVINTGLPSIKNFCALQAPATSASNRSGTFITVYDENYPNYMHRGIYQSGITNGVQWTPFGAPSGTNQLGVFIVSISGGTITINSGTRNDVLCKQDIHWFASA